MWRSGRGPKIVAKSGKKVGLDFKIPSTASELLVVVGAVLVGNVEGRAWSNDY